ncbi:helix-turn-helix domain-containing protein [Streptomyces sp. NPDC059785]|uniref:helix-turn-helix domain-containing protein n=1 Tax=Streptomyces sp. NPDC059785 TaxID=3346945 RepID=UPI0036509B3F
MADGQGEARRIGEVIRQARVLRQRSQNDVAAALGYHQSKVSRLESGRGTEDIRVLRAIARELDIQPTRLGLSGTGTGAGPDAADASVGGPGGSDIHRRTLLAASLTALTPSAGSPAPHQELVQALLPGSVATGDAAPAGAAELRERVGAARRLLYTCDYAALERTLPALITELRQAAAVAAHAATDVLSRLLATAYQTAASLLIKRNDLGSAWLAAGRAMSEAERSGDPAVLASSVRVQVHVLAREEHTAHAVTLVRHTSGQLSGSYDRRSPKYLAGIGLLLLRGVTAAGVRGDRAAIEEFLTEAKDVARYVCLDQPDVWANFCPVNVAVHEVSALVALGDAGLALQVARPLMRRPILIPERRAALWVEAARAYSQQNRLADAYKALRIADGCAAQDVRGPAGRELVADMAARDRGRTLPELHHFHRRLGAPA